MFDVTRPYAVDYLLAAVGAVVLLIAFRWRARTRARNLAVIVGSDGAEWVSLCRVVSGGASSTIIVRVAVSVRGP